MRAAKGESQHLKPAARILEITDVATAEEATFSKYWPISSMSASAAAVQTIS
jgi:hypothetical protein